MANEDEQTGGHFEESRFGGECGGCLKRTN